MRNCWSLKLSDYVLLLFVIAPVCSFAQFNLPKEKFPEEEKYLYPIRPGQPGSLAGTMGELRTTHFHSGIDIRTDNRIGMAVLASRTGYISRVATSGTSYGNVIYITHPDGYTTLYAHLDHFKGALAKQMLDEQYRVKSHEVEVFFTQDQFPVRKGDTIAWSGNTGSSGGPHLHFDIRDENNRALNPLKVADFPEIKDNLPPSVEKIALRTLDINSRINDKFGRFEFYAQRVGTNYIISSPILAHGTIGVEILSKDKLAYRSPFFGGVNNIEMQVDGKPVFSQAIEKINLSETRKIYTLMDFRTMRMKGTRFYKLYIDDGNALDFYSDSPGHGKIPIGEGKESKVDVLLKDSYNNTSKVSFRLKYDPLAKGVPTLEPLKKEIEYDILENTLIISSKPVPLSNKAAVYLNGAMQEKEPDYFNVGRNVFLFDLRKQIPDSIIANGQTIKPGIKATIPPATEYKFYGDWADVQFPANACYDTLYLVHNHLMTAESEIFTIGTSLIPIDKSIHVSLRTEKEYPKYKNYGVYRVTGTSSYAYIGGEWVNGRIQFSTRELGNFTLLRDTVPPTIKPISFNSGNVSFKINDRLSGISSFKVTIDGQWLLMHYDNKASLIWSERQDKTVSLKGELELEVIDNAGNKQLYNTTL